MNTKSFGDFGENRVAKYLLKQRYRILARNVRLGRYELDIVARDPSGVIVFVEVKSLQGGGAIDPAAHYNLAKDRSTRRAAQMFIKKCPDLFPRSQLYRIDLITVVVPDSLAGALSDVALVEHYQNLPPP